MDESFASALKAGIEKELASRFDDNDGAMAEYIIVMLQNGKDAPSLTEELKQLIANYDDTLTTWIFRQIDRLKAGQPIEPSSSDSAAPSADQDMAMDTETQAASTSETDQGMGYPSARLYSGLKKTLQENEVDQTRTRHRPDTEGVRSTPYGTVAVGSGAMRVPTGPRTENGETRQANSGPIRSKRGRGDRARGPGRHQQNIVADFPEMPQFPGFPMPPAGMFAGMPLMDRIDGGGMRPPTRRCTKWPTCFKGKACTFGHPTSMCPNPNCRKTDGTCPSIHADEDVDVQSGIDAQLRTEAEQEAKALAREQHKQAQSFRPQNGYHQAAPVASDSATPICKFGEACTNRACHFAHPSPASKNGSSIVLDSKFCPAGIECKDEQCSLSHPSPSNLYTPGVKLNTAAAEISCKFNPCLNPTCRFQHAPGQKSQATFGSARNKVWTPNMPAAPSTSERTFVSEEVEEQFNANSNVHDNDTEMEK